ncbi:DUF3718 domain-containing protein [Alteromonas sediminis]|uniref:DUF3718 domain-containing protein n=1 Tax=Alteromonas sediminis TaxID=2259342 RepID=A0A3N5XZ38_9ALTE|nr:DUF3718 domain-containing protein [Alteromonas sediminis]RPJ65980.1 DUF3718 domain-containing protein [Alteromonas sediminis]
MKRLTYTVTMCALAFSSTAFASKVKFEALNDGLATQACIVSATEGLEAAKALVQNQGLHFNTFKASVSCNNQSLTAFSRQYAMTAKSTLEDASQNKRIRLVATKTDSASQLCLDAVALGEEAARAKHNFNGPVSCNYKTLSNFVRRFKNKQVEIMSAGE